MSRPLRIEFENAYYHVMNRGRARQNIFHDEKYFECFLLTLAETCSRFQVEIHAYCLMSNHYHLLVKTPLANLQRAMRHLGGVYTQRYNRIKRTDGPLFRGRYKAIVVDHDEYLLHLSKYIHRNPLEAGLVSDLSDYRWSSYPSYVGLRAPDHWMKYVEVLGQMQAKRMIRKKYQAFVEDEGIHESLEQFYRRERLAPVLGDEAFISSIEMNHSEIDLEVSALEKAALRPAFDLIVQEVAKYYDMPISGLLRVSKGRGRRNMQRKIAMYLAQERGGLRLTEISKLFGLNHYGGVSHTIHHVRQELALNEDFAREINVIINKFDP